MTEQQRVSRPHRVVIGGGGVAALEALIALHHLAGDRVQVSLVAPSDEFVVRALSVEQPFGRPGSMAYDVEQACADHGATFRRDAIHAVRPQQRAVLTRNGALLEYDALLLALGARPVPAYEGTITFRGPYDADAMHALLRDVERGDARRIAFVVPPGTTWPLPLYELALMTAERARELHLDVELSLLTPEPAPLALFGLTASADVTRVLAERGIAVETSRHARDLPAGMDRIVAVPVLEGPRTRGLPADEHGFLPVDQHGRVAGVEAVFGAGDGTTMPIKQGGVAAQQADAAARAIARAAGADAPNGGFRPHLRAQLMTGRGSRWLREEPAGGAGDQASAAADHAPWWPPAKVAAPYLAPYLDRLTGGETGPAPDPLVRVVHGRGDPSGGVEVLGS